MVSWEGKRWVRWFCVLLASGAVSCSPERYQRSADRQVIEIVGDKRQQLTGEEGAYDFQYRPMLLSEVGRAGTVEDLRRTPPPKPLIETPAPDRDAGTQPAESPPAQPAAAESPPAQPPADVPQAPIDRAAPEPPAASQPAPGQLPPAAPGAAPASQPAPGAPAQGAQGAGAAAARAAPATAPVTVSVGAPEIPARILSLDEALQAALSNNRDYQTRKERVYLTALALTLVRWRFAPTFFGLITGEFLRNEEGESSGNVSTDFGWNQLFASGARLSISAASNFLRFFSGERREVAQTVVSGVLTQPLLRGFGRSIVYEPLIQAERVVLYEIRSFERFRQILVVDVASEYFRVLQNRNRVSNEYVNWQGLVNNLDRAQALAEGEKLPLFEVDQVRQQELEARNRYLVAVEDYHTSLDRFKLTIGLPVGAVIGLDERELPRLETIAALPVIADVEDAVAAAERLRLDLRNSFDQVEDARRQTKVAADSLRAQLDVDLHAAIPSDPTQPLDFDPDKGAYSVGFTLDLPFDRRAERNAYVASLIEADRQSRETVLLQDTIAVTVRDAHRRLLRERQTLQIQEASVRLAQARVDSTNALRDAGRAETRDVLESQSALIEARNALTSALINLAIARLEFHRDTGTLRTDARGRYTEDPIPERRANG